MCALTHNAIFTHFDSIFCVYAMHIFVCLAHETIYLLCLRGWFPFNFSYSILLVVRSQGERDRDKESCAAKEEHIH